MSTEIQEPRIPFTRFMDMHSGGSCKIDINGVGKQYIYIEAPEDAAVAIFEERFGRDPHNVTCNCCGNDYSISESPTLEEASGYDRSCKWVNGTYIDEPDTRRSWKSYKTVAEYVKQEDVLVIYANGVEQ
jgi:hypothetical protein